MFLDARKQKILGAVVRDYVETVRPIGSEELAARHDLGVKSATIRNELAELAEMGFLRQPHTSAGRIPSDQGYRFYVDHLMVVREVNSATLPHSAHKDYALELDHLLRQTCALLTRVTSYTSVATPPRPADMLLSSVFVTAAGENRLLIVAVFSAGQVENRFVRDIPEMTMAELAAMNNALNASFAGKALDLIVNTPAQVSPSDFSPTLRALFDTLSSTVRQIAQHATEENSLFLEGAHEILRQPEFRDISKIESVLETLQSGTALFQTLSNALLGPDVTVVIGEENHITAMQECSVVTASYYVGLHERGTIGVIGPTRMDYDRAVPAVQFFARTLSQSLTHLTVS